MPFRNLIDTKPEQDHFRIAIDSRMSLERALRIRVLRCDEGASWPEIAEICLREWGGDACWSKEDQQIPGFTLCDVAAAFLGEDYRRGAWDR
jgi:hypothetical protein